MICTKFEVSSISRNGYVKISILGQFFLVHPVSQTVLFFLIRQAITF